MVGILIFLCKILEPYNNPFWDFRGDRKKINLPKLVAYLSYSAGRTYVSDQNKMTCVKIIKDDIPERVDGLVYEALSFRNH